MCYSTPAVYAYVPNFISIGLFCCGPLLAKNFTIFADFFGLRHLVMLPIGSNLRKLNTGAQLQTLPYPTASKWFLYSNAFMAKSGAQSLTFKSVMDRQTRFWPLWQRLKPSLTKLCTVIRGPRACSCTLKTFRGTTHSFATGGCSKFEGNPTPQLKTPLTH